MRRVFPIGIACALLAAAAFRAVADEPRDVLVLSSADRDVAPFGTVARSFRTTLDEEFGAPVDVHEFALTPDLFPSPEEEVHLVEFLKYRLDSRPVDVVVPVGAPAARFTAKLRDTIFPNVPVVYAGADSRVMTGENVLSNATLVSHKINLPGIVEDILSLRPGTTNIVALFGSSPLERFWEGEFRREAQPFASRVGVTWLTGQRLDQILEHCAALPPRSFIMVGMFFSDASGVIYSQNEVLLRLRDVAHAPVFSYFGDGLGLGAIGGRMYRDREVGQLAARATIRILRGERPEQIPPRILESVTPVYDGRELRRWEIDEKNLPPGSEVRFREPSFWVLYRGWILAGAVLCIAQTALILGLLRSRAARKIADELLSESSDRLASAVEVAGLGFYEMGENARPTFLDERIRDLLGAPSDGEVNGRELWVAHIHPEDRPRVLEASQRVLEQGMDQVSIEYRYQHPEGRQIWIHHVSRVLRRNAEGRAMRVVGVVRDVTERKQSEVRLRSLSGRLIRAQEEERARLAKELHDGVSQNLALLAVELDMFGQRPESTPEGIRSRMDFFSSHVKNLSSDIHRFALALHPAKLQQLGLVAALGAVCREMGAAGGLTVAFTSSPMPRQLTRDSALCLYRVAQEALQNVVKHSGAKTARVVLEAGDHHIRMTVTDDGRGFDAAAQMEKGTLGLIGMAERVRLVRGEIRLESEPGRGTVVHVNVPLENAG